MVYVGIDVHRKRSQVAVLDEAGGQLSNRNYENSSEDLRAALEELEPGTEVAFEAAYGWGWLADMLKECELGAHLAHPSACKAIASARLKNDKVDARMLAHLLRTDLLPEAWIAPKEVRDLRSLLRHRASLVGVRTSLKNRIHAVLADEGLIVLGKVVEGTLAADLKIGMAMELTTMPLFVDDDGVERVVYAWRIAS